MTPDSPRLDRADIIPRLRARTRQVAGAPAGEMIAQSGPDADQVIEIPDPDCAEAADAILELQEQVTAQEIRANDNAGRAVAAEALLDRLLQRAQPLNDIRLALAGGRSLSVDRLTLLLDNFLGDVHGIRRVRDVRR